MWILTEDYELVDLSKAPRVFIEKSEGGDGFAVWVDSGSEREDSLLMSCDIEETAWYLMDAITDALGRGHPVFSVTAWLDNKIQEQLASEPGLAYHAPTGEKKP